MHIVFNILRATFFQKSIFFIHITGGIKINIQNTQKIKNLIENKKIIELLNSVLKLNIIQLQFIKTLKLEDISEYEFELIKTKAIIENEEEIDIYLKIIKNNKIKESIFCYWCTIYDEELCEKEINKKMILNKVIISELNKKRYQQSIFLEIENNINKILEFGTEINFIEINKYIEEIGILHFQENFDDDDVLMIGIKPNANKKDAKLIAPLI